MVIASGSLCRRLGGRGFQYALFQRPRLVLFVFFVAFAVFMLFLYSNIARGDGELETLREQFHSQNVQVDRLQNEIIDANVRMESLRNSEFYCQSNLKALREKVKECANPNSQFAQRNAFALGPAQNRVPFERGAANAPRAQQPKLKIEQASYPLLTPDGNFVPTKLWIHLDLKGSPFKPSFFAQILPFLKRTGVNGILLEWEDMFPYKGALAKAINGNAYTLEQVKAILRQARELKLEIVPLVQTFGHLEWILKLDEFSHFREDEKYPQVICFGSPRSWEIIADMITQVGEVHKEFDMNYFHMGADEVFQVGACNESIREMRRQGGRDKAILWHIARVASFIKKKYAVTVLAWHDMLLNIVEKDLRDYRLNELLEPVLWSYAEDLDVYLPFSNWMALKPFKNVWGASAFKGADGPMRFYTNPVHYIRNHESWTQQMTRVYREFDHFQGLIITGWSRYDHLAVLCELFPVGVPTLLMSIETILAGKPLDGVYEGTRELIQCSAPSEPGYVFGCAFPGRRVYELVNEFAQQSQQLHKYLDSDFDFNGWLSPLAVRELHSSAFYIEKILPYLDYYLIPLERIERDLREELLKHFFEEVADEFVLTYMSRDLELLRGKRRAAEEILKKNTFRRRPFIKFPMEANNEL